MSLLKRMRKGYAVYWADLPKDKFGRDDWELPIELRVRWSDGTVVVRGEDGEEKTYTATVFVDRELSLDGKLWRGRLDDLQSPEPPGDARKIGARKTTPKLNYRETLYVVYL